MHLASVDGRPTMKIIVQIMPVDRLKIDIRKRLIQAMSGIRYRYAIEQRCALIYVESWEAMGDYGPGKQVSAEIYKTWVRKQRKHASRWCSCRAH